MSWEQELATFSRERGPALVGYAYLLTGTMQGAEDLVQDGLVRAWSRRRTGSDIAWLEAYVRRAMLNAYLDEYRRHRRWTARTHLVAGPTTTPAPDSVAGDRIDVATALTHLSPRERACIVLRYYEDLTVREIAERLTLSEGTVKRYLSDAGHRLAPLLGPDAGLPTEDITTKGARR